MKVKNKKQEYLERQLQDYEQDTAMTGAERRALRKWVSCGHSVYENPGSRYLCDYGMEGQTFLEVYRQDAKIEKELSGKTKKDKDAWLKAYMGYDEPQDAPAPTQEQLKEHIRKLERELFHVWGYIGQEGLWNEAREYVDEHAGEAIPFEILI